MTCAFALRRLWLLAAVAALWTGNGMQTRAQTNNTDDTDLDNQSTRLSLAASNPFRMILRPTLFELDFVALSIVEEAMAKAILLSTDSSLVDVTITINQMNWLTLSDDDGIELIDGTVKTFGTERVPTSVLKFFAVGTFLLNSPAGSLAAVTALDDIVESAFKQERSEAFIELLKNSGDPLLIGVQDVAAIRTDSTIELPEPTPNTPTVDDDGDDGGPTLGNVDAILISVSAAICIGILYMIWQHHRDRGFIENQRIQNLNAYGRRGTRTNEDSSYASTPPDDEDQRHGAGDRTILSASSSKTSVINNRQNTPRREEEPSNDSSLFTTSRGSEDHSFVTNFSIPPNPSDINTHLNSRKNRYSSKVRISVESVQCDSRSLPTPTKKALTSTSSVQSQEDECKSTGALSITAFSTVLSSEFGPINWFRKSGSKGPATLLAPTESNIEEVVEEGAVSSGSSKNTTTSSSSSCSSEDVFHVGTVTTNVLASGSVANASDTVSSKASSSVVTEWMKTIQVVSSSDSKSGSEVTIKASSSEQSSTAENSSAEAPSVGGGGGEDASDIVSLEHSMANSRSIMVGSEADSTTMEF